ncbi:response regulator [Dankookia sp. P2]|uniref:response regulator n=1 Tax=Dankookia sp. P2 TaxID=3423955 RepID=UPI003D67B0F4
MAILLVEDDTAIRLTLAEHMEDLGLEVFDAADAEAAQVILEQPPGRITVLVTDLNLGPGETGLMLATKARRRLPVLRVVYATGSPEMLQSRIMRPWERLFIKPYDACRLASEVQVLDRALLGAAPAVQVRG